MMTVNLDFGNTRGISINFEALNVVLGTFYDDQQVPITQDNALGVLIIARHLQLGHVAAKVEEFLELLIVPQVMNFLFFSFS